MYVMLDLKEKDKQQHLLAGILVTAILYPIFGHFAVMIGIGVGLVKEYIVDEIWSFGEPDIWDAVATALGALLVGGLVVLAELVSPPAIDNDTLRSIIWDGAPALSDELQKLKK